MKKIISLGLMVVILMSIFSVCGVVTVSAARPTELTITQVFDSPVIDGVIDEANGPMQWNQTASEIPIGEYDLFPRTPEECAPFAELYKIMNMKGYLSFDNEGICIAVQATDFLPKAAPNSNEPWKSTNIEIVLYTNDSRNFFTVAYAGTDTACIFNDETRSELEIEKVTEYCVKEKVDGNIASLVWEVKIPYTALWNVDSMDDIDDMRLGVVQASMSADISGYGNVVDTPYACQAFGKAYSLVYEDLLPVTIEYKVIQNGWVNEDGRWAYYENGVRLINRWKEDRTGWCYLGSDGYCVTSAWIKDSVSWCYVDANGYCITNQWQKDSKGLCYLDANGRMATNKWIKDGSDWYYVGTEGYRATECWKKDGYDWCYLDATGRMATNKWVEDRLGWCYVGANGYCVRNSWQKDSFGWCYLDGNGLLTKSQWIFYKNEWYYINSSGYMVYNTTITLDGVRYTFNYNGMWVA